MRPLIERFPTVAIPADGESLFSIYSRTAEENFLTLRDVAPIVSSYSWVDPDEETITRFAHDLSMSESEVHNRTLTGQFPRVKTRTLLILSKKFWQPCASCGIHRPEFDFRYTFSCTRCNTLLRPPENEVVVLSDEAIRAQKLLLDELRYSENPRLVTLLYDYARVMELAIWNIDNRSETLRLRELFSVSQHIRFKRNTRRITSTPHIAACATFYYLQLQREASPRLEDFTPARFAFESVDWKSQRAAGKSLRKNLDIETFLYRIGLRPELIPTLIPDMAELEPVTALECDAWLILSLRLTRRLFLYTNHSRAYEEVAQIHRIDKRDSRIAQACELDESPSLKFEDDDLFAWAAKQLTSQPREFGKLREYFATEIRDLIRKRFPDVGKNDENFVFDIALAFIVHDEESASIACGFRNILERYGITVEALSKFRDSLIDSAQLAE